MAEFTEERPFPPSMYTYFRKRFPAEALARINKRILSLARETPKEKPPEDDGPPSVNEGEDDLNDSSEPKNQGKLLMDATCALADIAYPKDLKLLNQTREKSEAIIDVLHEARGKAHKKPRTYRIKARKKFLSAAKSMKLGGKKRRKAIKAQLGVVRRDLGHIEALSHEVGLEILAPRQYKDLQVISEVYRQQQWMYDNKTKRVDDRIVSLSQPHVRPIRWGSAGKDTEFGAKLSLSLLEGFGFVDRSSWNNYNESADLIPQIKDYKKRFGVYSESVYVDATYRRTKTVTAPCPCRILICSGSPKYLALCQICGQRRT